MRFLGVWVYDDNNNNKWTLKVEFIIIIIMRFLKVWINDNNNDKQTLKVELNNNNNNEIFESSD